MQNTTKLKAKALFNPDGDTDVRERRLIGGNTTNLNDFNNLKYAWASDWYRQAMNNFWIPEEINLSQDVKDYPKLSQAERTAYDKILSFLVFLDSLQTANLPNIGEFITANEVNLCLHIQTFQECVHSQSYSYMLDTICSPEKRNEILYQWKTDAHLLARNTFIGNLYNEFQEKKDAQALLRVMMANFILEGVYFYSGFMFFYNLARMGKMPGSAQEIRYINRDENTPGTPARRARALPGEGHRRPQGHAPGRRRAGDCLGHLCHRRRYPRPYLEAGRRLHPLSRESALELSGHGRALSRIRRRTS